MGKAVFIAEKPSVAREFAKALKLNTKSHDGYLESENTIITWCVGHLVNMCYPESYDEALAFLKSLDETKYPQIAIQYEETCVGYETSYKYWLVMTQFEIKPKRKMSKDECLDCLYDLMEQLNNSTDDMALDQYRAVEIAVALIENSTDKTFKEAV